MRESVRTGLMLLVAVCLTAATAMAQIQTGNISVKAVDDQGRELLRGLNADIRRLVDASEEDADDSLLERLQESIDYFESTHPRLTTALSQLLNALNNAGI